MSQIYPITRDTKRKLYCGPTAICAVTGLPASVVLAEIDRNRGEDAYTASGQLKGVRGMWAGEVQAVLRRLGFITARIDLDGEGSFARYLEGLQQRGDGNTRAARIVMIRGHYLAVSGDGKWVCDTKTKYPVPAHRAPTRRAKVHAQILVWKKEAGRPVAKDT